MVCGPVSALDDMVPSAVADEVTVGNFDAV